MPIGAWTRKSSGPSWRAARVGLGALQVARRRQLGGGRFRDRQGALDAALLIQRR